MLPQNRFAPASFIYVGIIIVHSKCETFIEPLAKIATDREVDHQYTSMHYLRCSTPGRTCESESTQWESLASSEGSRQGRYTHTLSCLLTGDEMLWELNQVEFRHAHWNHWICFIADIAQLQFRTTVDGICWSGLESVFGDEHSRNKVRVG